MGSQGSQYNLIHFYRPVASAEGTGFASCYFLVPYFGFPHGGLSPKDKNQNYYCSTSKLVPANHNLLVADVGDEVHARGTTLGSNTWNAGTIDTAPVLGDCLNLKSE